ncbi:MAG TPA: NAD(P)H-binding protein [Myxococcota bacterium]|jgi:uncharacterized protein YbjT (DUF2867 family)
MTTRNVAIAGATGLVGQQLLAQLLADERVARVTALVRRPLLITSEKLIGRVVDFSGDLEEHVPKDLDDAYCALGTTMKVAGSREAFIAVDKTAVLAFARACRARGARRFLLVTSVGADARSMTFYLRVKGETEEAVRALGFDAVHVMRPSFLDGKRVDSRPGEKIGLALFRVLKPVLGNYGPIDVGVVARAMIRAAYSDRFGNFVHDNRAIESLASG